MKRLERHEYTAGWICPLEVEQIAALHMLDERHSRLPQPPTDHNVYNLGSIHGHNVVIAGLPQAGNNAAATVVTQLRMSFPNVRFVLLVGIGGGVPRTTDEGMLRLGDVVVSKPTGAHSGVIQYDHGKAWVGRFERTGSLAPPPAVLLNAAQNLAAARAMEQDDSLDQNMKRIDSSKRNLRRFAYPGIAQDRLFLPGYVHLQQGVSCDESSCDLSQTIARRGSNGLTPIIIVHRGTIASGEMVLKDAMLRDRLAADGLICFEMEAAGALIDFPCMVIRGISDYCDSHNNDAWHGYAAAAAASYARQLFLHIPIEETPSHSANHTPSVMRRLENGLQDMSSQMSSLVLSVDKLQSQHQMSSVHTQGFLAANDEDGFSKMVRAYIRQAIQDCKTGSDDNLMTYVDAISMDISSDAQQHALFSPSNQPASDVLEDADNLSPIETAHPVATLAEGANNRKPRFIKLFRTERHFYSKLARINVRVNQLRKRCILIPDTLSYFSIEVDIFPRLLAWGLSLSFTTIPNEGGYFGLCPSIRPIRIRAMDDPIEMILRRDDIDAFELEYKAGRVSASDHHQLSNRSIFETSLMTPTLKCLSFMLAHSEVPIATLFESAGYLYTEDFLDVSVFGQGHDGNFFTLTDLAVDIIKASECEPEGRREDIFIWYNLWGEAQALGLSPTDNEPITWMNRILSLGINFAPFSWSPVDYDDEPDILDYHRWMLEMCLSKGGNPNSELGFATECVPLEFALELTADMRLQSLDDFDCYDLAYSLLLPLIDAGANIYYIREVNGVLRSITDLAFELEVECCWKMALSICDLDLVSVIEEDERNLLLRRRGEPAVVTGIDVESIKPERSGLRRRN